MVRSNATNLSGLEEYVVDPSNSKGTFASTAIGDSITIECTSSDGRDWISTASLGTLTVT